MRKFARLISWDVCTGGVLQMEISNTSTGYISFGFSAEQLMPNTVLFLGGVNDSGTYGYDGFALGYYITEDASDDFNILSA